MNKRTTLCFVFSMVVVALLSAPAHAQTPIVRLQVVNVPVDSGLLAELLPEFEATTGYKVQVEKNGEEVYRLAREGKADLVISHYGHAGTESFMMEDLGLWPRAVFGNQAVLIGPATDRAGIRGVGDAVEAFRRIAQSKSRFILNNAPTERYLAHTLWEAAGRPDPTDWFMDSGLRDQQAIQTAERMGAYVLWGIVPFLKYRESAGSTLEPLVADDQLFQRMMVSIVVNPEKIAGVNVPGAVALQKYLSAPSTQAKIRSFRQTGFPGQIFWPAARDNSGAFLVDLESSKPENAPVPSGLAFDPANPRVGSAFRAVFSGTNFSADTYFDIRFQAPGSTKDEIVFNWQQGSSANHTVTPGTQAGTWRITGIRAHQERTEHTGSFVPVSVTLTVTP